MPETNNDPHTPGATHFPPNGSVTAVFPGLRTPRWIWAWIIPAAALILLIMAQHVLGPFVIAAVIAYIFSMVVDTLQERLRWPRGLIVTALYLLVLGALGLGLYFGASALYKQTSDLVRSGPDIVESVLKQVIGGSTYSFGGQTLDAHALALRVNAGINNYFGTNSGDALRIASLVVERLLDALLVIIVSFYLLLDGRRVSAYFLKFVPAESRMHTGYVAGRINTVLSAYLRGQLLLILIMSVVSFIVLQFIFQVPFALPLAILTGFLEILPLLGPGIAATLAAGVALFANGPVNAILVIVAYTVLRELEDQVVMPFVVGRAVELHPVVTIFAVLAGGAIAGPIGMLLAVPAAAAVKVILDVVYPTDVEQALAQARPGLARAEAEEDGEEDDEKPAPPARLDFRR